ncbi:hypothetical protein [Sinorhizobium fredii]|uniref:hypothetical protein n=1 Tax=Rhizobium fredii TaxID=380 RepID=UPI0005956D61|nr:hypothetical protein [Sinorhizobium fredii]WOS65344.1 hypothetical protein SFGR64A_27955 [Sinorhizobium fredii GR64]
MPNAFWNTANIERVVEDVKQRLRARQAQSVVTVPKIEAQISAPAAAEGGIEADHRAHGRRQTRSFNAR